jgi:hypothetical protein
MNTTFRLPLLALLVLLSCLSARADTALTVDDSSTRIGFAKAHLAVSNATIVDGVFLADATVRVPLGRYETVGTLSLPLAALPTTKKITVTGTFTDEDSVESPFTCTLEPKTGSKGNISITVANPAHTLTFDTTYSTVSTGYASL